MFLFPLSDHSDGLQLSWSMSANIITFPNIYHTRLHSPPARRGPDDHFAFSPYDIVPTYVGEVVEIVIEIVAAAAAVALAVVVLVVVAVLLVIALS